MSQITITASDLVSPETAKSLLEPYFSKLRECFRTAWSRWEEFARVAPELHGPLRSRTRANFIYDHIVSEVENAFHGDNTVRVSAERGFLLLHIRNRFLLRFKKLDESRRPRNVPTKQQRSWFSVQLEIPGFPPRSVRLIAGYQLDKLETEIQDILITHQIGRSVRWHFSIKAADQEEQQAEIVPIQADVSTTVHGRKPKAIQLDGEE